MDYANLFPIGFFSFFILVIAIAVGIGWSRQKKFRNNLSQLALTLGLEYKPGSWLSKPSARGQYRGREVSVGVVVRGSSKNRREYTQMHAGYSAHITEDMALEPESAVTWITKKFGAQDTQTGDDEFDKKYRIGIKDQNTAMTILTPEIKQKLLETKLTVWIRNGRVTAAERGLNNNQTDLMEKINLLTVLAEKIDRL
jgi:hypothetical protein